jgi:hypothetical protein
MGPMNMERAWRWQLYRGSAVALMAPAAVVAALTVLALAGGFSRLASLGQILSGPPAPSAAVASGSPAQTAPVLQPTTAAAPVKRIATRTTVIRGHAASARPSRHARPGASSRVPPPVPVVSHRTPPAPAATTPSAPAPAPRPPAPAPGSTPVDHVIGVGTGVTSKLPDPVGTVTTKALQTVGQTVDKVLPSQLNSVTGATLGLLHL